ncbi:MAG: orotidine-5'-phosphate decarboxylase [Thermoplasmata archaeon]|nr:MAG: orotidine-5'-phosphate decarboxylase [Thermoplasmata archaeon]
MDFKQKLIRASKKNNTLLCVGLDIDKEKIPRFLLDRKEPFVEFNKAIIDATNDLVCAYKLNIAFYEILAEKAYDVLKKTIDHIPKDIPVILDGKRNDITHTAEKYAKTIFEIFNADATTVNPYLGFDSIKPFLEYKEKSTFILCRTSNPSAREIQDLKINNKPLYQIIAEKARKWNKYSSNCGLVVGATYPTELKIIRETVGEDLPILIPGIGKQGGNIEKTVKNGTNSKGELAIINSSRSIIYASNNENFAKEARKKAISLKEEINKYR